MPPCVVWVEEIDLVLLVSAGVLARRCVYNSRHNLLGLRPFQVCVSMPTRTAVAPPPQ